MRRHALPQTSRLSPKFTCMLRQGLQALGRPPVPQILRDRGTALSSKVEGEGGVHGQAEGEGGLQLRRAALPLLPPCSLELGREG